MLFLFSRRPCTEANHNAGTSVCFFFSAKSTKQQADSSTKGDSCLLALARKLNTQARCLVAANARARHCHQDHTAVTPNKQTINYFVKYAVTWAAPKPQKQQTETAVDKRAAQKNKKNRVTRQSHPRAEHPNPSFTTHVLCKMETTSLSSLRDENQQESSTAVQQHSHVSGRNTGSTLILCRHFPHKNVHQIMSMGGCTARH